MSTSRIALWVLSISAVFVLMAMNLWTVPIIRTDIGDLRIFDNRPFGYGLEDARALWILTDEWRKPYRIAICLAGFLGPMCDLTENHFVAGLLRAGPDGVTAEMVARASAFSVTKWVLDIIAAAAFLFLSWHFLLERWRGH